MCFSIFISMSFSIDNLSYHFGKQYCLTQKYFLYFFLMNTFSLFMQWVTMCFRKDIRGTTGTLKHNLEVSEKVKYACSCKLAILFLVVYPIEVKTMFT